MSSDLLERATQALRSTTGSTPADLERGLERLSRRAPRQRSLVLEPRYFRTLAWTVALMLLGVGAWANATGRLRWFAPAALPPPEPAPNVAPAPRARPLPERVAPPPQSEPEPAPAPEPPPAPAPAPKKARATPVRPAPPPPARADSDALYRAAHDAHFKRGDYEAALAAWDHYLAAAEPGHRFWLEASYNRGIALYHLGRSAEARRALEPFARGDYGGYRRADARRLLEALPAD